MKTVAQVQAVPQQYTPPPHTDPNTVVGILVGVISALGLPQILKMFAAAKVEEVKAERRKDDGAYTALYTALESMLKAVTQMNSTMMAGQSSSTSESFQLMATLVQEISLLRDTISNNTEITKQAADSNEMLAHEIHEMRVSFSEEIALLKSEVMQVTRNVKIT